MDFSNRRRMRNMVVDTGQAAKQTNTHTSYTPTSFFYLNIIKVIIIYHRKKKILILILYDPKKKAWMRFLGSILVTCWLFSSIFILILLIDSPHEVVREDMMIVTFFFS